MVHSVHKHPRFIFCVKNLVSKESKCEFYCKMWKMCWRRFLCGRPQRKPQSECVTSFTQIASTFLSKTLKWFICYRKTWNGRKYNCENVKKNAIWFQMPFASLGILRLAKNQMSKKKSHLEMDIFTYFKFFQYKRKCFMLGFAAGLIDETCNLQFSFKQNQKIFYADIRCIWNFSFLKHEKIIRVPFYLA